LGKAAPGGEKSDGQSGAKEENLSFHNAQVKHGRRKIASFFRARAGDLTSEKTLGLTSGEPAASAAHS
jgi:hypothetical protein